LSFISFRDDRIMISVSDVETCSSNTVRQKMYPTQQQ
jgi:hypothetical protein